MRRTWTRDLILASIRAFVIQQKRVPYSPDFQQCLYGLPNTATVRRYFATVNEAVRVAGYTPAPPPPPATKYHAWNGTYRRRRVMMQEKD